MKIKINLDTLTDVKKFCETVNQLDVDVFLVDPKNKYQVNAKSILGCLLSQAEWNDIWVECEEDIYQLISEWVII